MFFESLEGRRLLSAAVLNIRGPNAETGLIDLNYEQEGLYWRVGDKSHFRTYDNLKRINVRSGSSDGKGSRGDHTINITADVDNHIPVNVFGTKRSINRINVFNAAVPVTVKGGDKSRNILTNTTTATTSPVSLRGGKNSSNEFRSIGGGAHLVGGRKSTNEFYFGPGSNSVFGGNNSRNNFFADRTNAQGTVIAGKKSRNTLITPGGATPTVLEIKGHVPVSATAPT
jgi:hypothetical protein